MSSPTQRSLKLLRDRGYLAEVTEKNMGFRGKKWKRDLFKFIDIVAIRGDETLGVQTTSGSSVAARITKIKGLQSAQVWLESPTRKIVVHGWRKKANGRYECREEQIGKEMF